MNRPARNRASVPVCLCAFVPLCLLFSLRLFAENLVTAGSNFEAGLAGFDVCPVLFPQNYKTYVGPQIDATTAAQGKRSLKLTNASGQDTFYVFSRGIRIESEGTATLSLYARSDSPGVRLDFQLCNGWKAVLNGSGTLEGDWKRFHVTNTMEFQDLNGAPGWFYIRIHVGSPRPWKSVWIDGVQLEKGPLSDYVDPSPVELAFEMDRDLKVYHPDETPRMTLKAAGNKIAGQKVKVQVEELFSKRKEPEMMLELKEDGDADHGTAAIPLKPRPRGSYRATAATMDGKAVQFQVYGVIEPLGGRPRAERAFFGGSIENIMNISPWLGLPESENSLCVYRYDPEKVFAVAHDFGWGWWHAYHTFAAHVIQPDSPTISHWKDSDFFVALAQKHDLEIYANMAGHGALDEEWPPAWMRTAALSKGGTSMGKGQRLVDAQKFGQFAKAVAEHYKGAIRMWEPFNEPGVKMREEDYMPLQEAAYRAVKTVDPENKVFGLCGTWDVAGDLYGWVKTCLKLGAADSMDGIAIHGYHVLSRDYVAKVRQLARETVKKDFPIIDSEAGNELSTLYPSNPNTFKPEQTTPPPDEVAHETVAHLADVLAHGGARQSWFNLVNYMDGIFCHTYTLFEYDGAPAMNFIACNAFMDRMGGARFKEQIVLGGDVVIYVFDVKGKGVAMLWADASPQRLEIPVSPDQVYVENLAGQREPPQKGEQGGIRLELARQLYYVIGKDIKAGPLAEALRHANLPDLKSVEVTRVGISGEGKVPALAVKIKGRSVKKEPVGIELLELPDDWAMASSRVDLETGLDLDEEKTLLFPIEKGFEKGAEQPIQIGLDRDKGMVTEKFLLKLWTATAVKKAVQVDGDLSEWDAALFHPLAPWVSAALQWDEKGLYVAAKVEDATVPPAEGAKGLWDSDCLELFFNPALADSFKDRLFGPGDCQVICSVRGGDAKGNRVDAVGGPQGINKTLKPSSVKMASRQSAGGYTVEIFFPWSNLPSTPVAGNFMGFDLSVRDEDRAHQEAHRAIWAGDNDDYRYTDKYGVLILTP